MDDQQRAEAVESALSGQWVTIGDLDVSHIAQEAQLECYCSVVYIAGGALAHVKFKGIAAGCEVHTFEFLGRDHYVGLKSRVWVAPDAILIGQE